MGLISKEEYYGLFIGFRPSGRVQPVQLWWLVNLPVNSLSQIFTFDLLRLTNKAAIAFDRCVLIKGSILVIVCLKQANLPDPPDDNDNADSLLGPTPRPCRRCPGDDGNTPRL